MKKILSLLSLMLLSIAGFGHGQQVAYCVLSNGFIRVYIEHWHGDFPSVASIAGNSINVTTTYGSNVVNQNIDPSGVVNNTTVNNLPGCNSNINIISTCASQGPGCTTPGSNQCNDWGYWDFAPAACNVPVSITVNAGNTVVFAEACTNLYPATATATFTDNAGPVMNCQNITVNADPGQCGAIVNYPEPTVTDACQNCPSSNTLSGYNYMGDYQGHKYFKSISTSSWASQNAAAQSAGGHLATIGSAGENATVSAWSLTVPTPNTGQAWIGFNDEAVEGTFVWANGEPVVYTNWCLNEPNNLGGEDYTTINWCLKADNTAGWNDLPASSNLPGILEFDCIAPVRTAGPASGSFFPIGTTTVTYTATDNSNNTSTCSFTVTVNGQTPTCSITSTPTSGTYSDGNPNHIYMGYGNGKTTLTATGSGSGLTYSWSPAAGLSCTNCANPVFTPTAGGIYTFNATVTNSNGCVMNCSITICVIDVRVPGQNNKVYICHVPPGNPAAAHTLAVGVNAVSAHLSNHGGDRLGPCDQSCGGFRMAGGNHSVVTEEVKVYPNPNNGSFTVELPYIEDVAAIHVTDVAGKTIQHRIVKDGDGNKLDFRLDHAAKGVYFVEVSYGDQRFRTKLFIQ